MPSLTCRSTTIGGRAVRRTRKKKARRGAHAPKANPEGPAIDEITACVKSGSNPAILPDDAEAAKTHLNIPLTFCHAVPVFCCVTRAGTL
ncbi:hypothetical protein PSP6_690061 [Paraburkholderia tropica]|nr:hypothetical protein PSP6_690061 [Paraburkholderia tropica]